MAQVTKHLQAGPWVCELSNWGATCIRGADCKEQFNRIEPDTTVRELREASQYLYHDTVASKGPTALTEMCRVCNVLSKCWDLPVLCNCLSAGKPCNGACMQPMLRSPSALRSSLLLHTVCPHRHLAVEMGAQFAQSIGHANSQLGKNHLEERLLDQAQARASYTPLFWGHSRSIPQGMILDVQPLVKSLFCPIRASPNGFFDFEASTP